MADIYELREGDATHIEIDDGFWVWLELTDGRWLCQPTPWPTRSLAEAAADRVHNAGCIDLDTWTNMTNCGGGITVHVIQ